MLSVVLAALTVQGAAVKTAVGPAEPQELAAKFATFIQTHGRNYATGSSEYHLRLKRFEMRQAAVDAHNRQQGRTWKAGTNHLADRTPEELAMLRGYRHTSKGSTRSASLVAISNHALHNVSHLPEDFSYKGQLKAMDNVVDQGGCGSCWAVSSATALRGHSELYQNDRTFSAQQILECTPNPKSCGGQGGCRGATSELAMDYVARYGSATAEDLAYLGKDGPCPSNAKPAATGFLSTFEDASSMTELNLEDGGGSKFGMTGWRKLPENKAEGLLLALYEDGPAVVSVAANDAWSMYDSGVLNACDTENPVINHAVVAVGFGKEGNKKYWHIQNSWGPSWGEEGFLKLQRLDTKDENAYCGWDKTPEEGTACTDGPKKVYVCGQCGVLYDSVVPKFKLGASGLKAHQQSVDPQRI